MPIIRIRLCLGALTLSAILGSQAPWAIAALDPGGAPSSTDALSNAGFISAAAQDSMTEVQLAKLALRRSHATGIRQFSMMMVSDHTKLLQQLKSFAGSDPLAMPSQLDAEHSAVIKSFSKRANFDAAYIDQMIQAHDQAIELFTRAAESADPAIAQFAKSKLPTLQSHRERALALKPLKGASSPM